MNNIINPSIAANIYAQNKNIGDIGISSGNDGVKFSDFLKDKAQGAIEKVRAGEEMSAKAITGEAGVAEVVQAVTEADLTVSTAKAMIDRMISAYQEIMRLPI